jgi:hypothetical protein
MAPAAVAAHASLGDLDPDDAMLAGGDEATAMESAPELADLPPAIRLCDASCCWPRPSRPPAA